ncbi:MAG: NUDIX domain-containing protein [Vicingaceae bacterium]
MQKYTVFINDHLVSITEKAESNQQYHSELFLKQAREEEIVTLVKWLLKESKQMKLGLLSDAPQQHWELFQKQFTIIEAAGGLVKNKNGAYLFIYRLGKWDLPKGKIEQGESAKVAAVREVEEECGISQLKLGKELPPTYHIYQQKQQLILKRTYWFEMNYNGDEALVPQGEEGIEKVVWVPQNNLKDQIENTYESLKPMIDKLC